MFKTIKKAKNGDQDALLFLINKFKPLIKKYSRQLPYEEAETDLIICFIEKIKKFNLKKFKNKNDAMIISYIHHFMKSRKIDLFRKYIKNSKKEIEINLDITVDLSTNDFEESIFIETILDSITKLQKKILISKFLYGYSDREIAKAMSISRQAVNRAKNRAIKTIRNNYKVTA